VYALPTFVLTTTSKGVVTTAFAVSGDELVSGDSASISAVRVYKVKSATSVLRFDRVETAKALQAAEGKFTILDSSGKYASTIYKSGTYYVYLSLKDGGSYDFDGLVNGVIFDPTCLGYKVETGGSSGGGCSAFGFAPMALLFLAPMAFLARKRG
jgi:Synergist-CTERM protein sorting domain-containing protein